MGKRLAPIICMTLMVAACAHAPVSDDISAIGERIAARACPGTAPVVVRTEPNRHVEGVTDSIRSLRCDGIEVQTLVSPVASDPSGLLTRVEVTAPGHGLPAYMEIGQSVRAALSRLGPPAARENGQLVYPLDGESESRMSVEEDAGKVRAVRWDWYVD